MSEVEAVNDQAPFAADDVNAALASRFRRLSIALILAATVVAVLLVAALRVRVDLQTTTYFNLAVAGLLLASRMWWDRRGSHGIADASGAVAVAGLGGMACGAVAMLELRFHLPLADAALHSFDQKVGMDGIAILEALVRQGHWIFNIMSPAYNFTLHIFFASLIVLALKGDRLEAWRSAFCFVGTLLTACVVAAFVPAKGLGVWASDDLLLQLPERAMKTFWPHFDQFYFGEDPVLGLQAIDGVICFPSFHAVVGFLTVAMWRKKPLTLLAASIYLFFMLLAIFPGGGHYFVDMLGGFAVFAAWFAWSLRIERDGIIGRQALRTLPV